MSEIELFEVGEADYEGSDESGDVIAVSVPFMPFSIDTSFIQMVSDSSLVLRRDCGKGDVIEFSSAVICVEKIAQRPRILSFMNCVGMAGERFDLIEELEKDGIKLVKCKAPPQENSAGGDVWINSESVNFCDAAPSKNGDLTKVVFFGGKEHLVFGVNTEIGKRLENARRPASFFQKLRQRVPYFS